jgi:hypothetical protein
MRDCLLFVVSLLVAIIFIILSSVPALQSADLQSWQCIEWHNVTADAQLCTQSCQVVDNMNTNCTTICESTTIQVPKCVTEMLVRNVSG